MSDRSRKLTKVGMGPVVVGDSGKVPKLGSAQRVACPAPVSAPPAKLARKDEALAYRPTVPAPPVSSPPSGRKTAAYDSFVDATESAPLISEPPVSDLVKTDGVRSEPVRSELVRSEPVRSEPVKSDRARPPRTSVRRTEPPAAPDETPPPRSARISVRRSEPPDAPDRSTRSEGARSGGARSEGARSEGARSEGARSGREAISVDEVGPSRRDIVSLPPGARPRVAPRKKGAPSPPLNGRDAHVLVYVNGVRTVKEIVDASKLRPSETATSLQKLIRIGVIVF